MSAQASSDIMIAEIVEFRFCALSLAFTSGDSSECTAMIVLCDLVC